MENVLPATGFVRRLSHSDCVIHWRTTDPSGTQLQVHLCACLSVCAHISVCAALVWEMEPPHPPKQVIYSRNIHTYKFSPAAQLSFTKFPLMSCHGKSQEWLGECPEVHSS